MVKNLLFRISQMRKKHLIVLRRNRDGDIEYTLTEEMPAWMSKTLALGGINRTFTIKSLTQKQRGVVDCACELADMQKEGIVEIIYEPKVNNQPIVSLTEKGRQASNQISNHGHIK